MSAGQAPDERLSFPREQLRGRTVRGVALNALFIGGSEVLLLIQGLIVTAILGPEAIGLYGVVSATAMTITNLKRVGIDEEFVRQAEAGAGGGVPASRSRSTCRCRSCFAFVIAAAAPFVALALRRRPSCSR